MSPAWGLASSPRRRPIRDQGSKWHRSNSNIDGRSAHRRHGKSGPAGLTYKNRTLFDYVQLAYGVEGYRISHEPSISLEERYDIIAKAAGPVPAQQISLMLQVLLEERLQVVVHRENREIPVYILAIGKNGPRFKPAPENETPGMQNTGEGIEFRRSPVSALAGLLSGMPSLGRPVLDRTGLTGLYDIMLRLDDQPGKNADRTKGDLVRAVDEAVFANVSELGLRLEPQKAAVEFVVVDHVGKIPSGN